MKNPKPGSLFRILHGKHYYQPLSWPDDSDDWQAMPLPLAGILLEFLEGFALPETLNSRQEISLEDANNWILDAYRQGQSSGW